MRPLQIGIFNSRKDVRRTIVLKPGEFSVGRDRLNDIVLDSAYASARHFGFTVDTDRVTVRDFGSTNGTYVGGARIAHDEDVPVDLGSPVLVGECQMVFQMSPLGTQMPERLPLPPPVDTNAEAVRELKGRVQDELFGGLDLRRLIATGVSEEEIAQRVRTSVQDLVAKHADEVPTGVSQDQLTREVIDEVLGMGPLTELMADKAVEEIMVNTADRIYVSREGKTFLTDKTFTSTERLLYVIEKIVSSKNRRIDESTPYVDTRLDDGSRVNAVIPPVAIDGPLLTIRRFPEERLGPDDLIEMQCVHPVMMEYLQACVVHKKNILVSGGTASGKTTFLNILSSYIPEDERIITIEDAAELSLPQEHVARMESRPPSLDGKAAVTIRDLVINSLRMRPDRIVVGECRGGEAIDMLQAMNTGHEGSLTTLHANSTADTIRRLVSLCLMSELELPAQAILDQIASAIDVIVQLARQPDGTRKVVEIAEIWGQDDTGHPRTVAIFRFRQTGVDPNGWVRGRFVRVRRDSKVLKGLQARGIQVSLGEGETE